MNYKQHHNEVAVQNVDLFTEQQLMYLMYLEVTIRMMKGPMERQMQVEKLVQVVTINKVRTIQIILMLKALMHAHLKIKVDLLLNEGKRSNVPVESAQNIRATTELEEYVDLALAAISRKIKDTLSKNEVMDFVKNIQ